MNIKDATVGSCVKDQERQRLGIVVERIVERNWLRIVFAYGNGGYIAETLPPTGLILISQA